MTTYTQCDAAGFIISCEGGKKRAHIITRQAAHLTADKKNVLALCQAHETWFNKQPLKIWYRFVRKFHAAQFDYLIVKAHFIIEQTMEYLEVLEEDSILWEEVKTMANQIDTARVDKARQLLDQALQLLREDRDVRVNAKQSGARELSEAITNFETGSMFMIRSLFADQPYTPMLKLQPADTQPTPATQAAAEAQKPAGSGAQKPSGDGSGTSAPAA